jgi:hypothetical protein
MRLIAFLLFCLLSLKAVSQSKLPVLAEPTSRVIVDISRGWKKDTLGKTGYRAKVFERLRYSKVDSISKQDLFRALGKPHHISKFFSGNTGKNYIGYRYYVLCMNEYPKDRLYVGSFIEFVFDETEIRFIEINDGDYCE